MILNNIKSTYLILFLWLNFQLISCAQQPQKIMESSKGKEKVLKMGAERVELYLNELKGKNIAVVANQTSVLQFFNNDVEVKKGRVGDLNSYHLVDYLYANKDITLKKVFAPEHGFRGKADAGEKVLDGIDTKTGISIVSLYGKNKKPSQEQLRGIDLVVFDIQDVGARFYTYISSLHYVMEACAESNIPVILLDRPNPNGHYIDGPLLEMEHKSFIGMHPIPVVYGMTIGEYGYMINGEKWLKDGLQCDYKVVPLKNYKRNRSYNLPIKPSPNLPNVAAVNLYPSLCFFEGTNVSVGRGTENQFQVYGSPNLEKTNFRFVPIPNEGSKYPKHENKVCFGEDLRNQEYLSQLNLSWLIKAYKNTADKNKFFTSFFTTLAGTKKLQKQIELGITEEAIKKSWKDDLDAFKIKRAKYLIYN